MRRSLALYTEVIDFAPAVLVARHGSAPARPFAVAVQAASDRLLKDAFRIPQDLSPGDLLLAAAVQARAADDLLSELAGSQAPETPNDPGQEWRVDSASSARFVIPRTVERRRSVGDEGRIRLRTVDLVRKHTILPVRTAGYDVRLVWRDLTVTQSAGFAATLYDHLELRCPPEGEGFCVEGVDCVDHQDQLLEGLQRSAVAGAAVWIAPELTLDGSALQALIQRLGRRLDWDSSPRAWPALSVPGSMHIVDPSGERRNRALVLDAQGFEILRFDKLLAFEDPDLGTEAIGYGDAIHVLATPTAVIGFGICRDFCERALPSPFAGLDLDYVLVPSFGGEVSMQGHIATASELQMRERTRAFVVQQAYPLPRKSPGQPQALGYVLPPRASLGTPLIDTLVSVRWSLHSTD